MSTLHIREGMGATRHRLTARSVGFGDPAQELDESDIIAQAQAREEAERAAIPDPMDDDPKPAPARWSAKELGILVLDTRDGVRQEETAKKLERSLLSVREQVVAVRRWMGAKTREDAARKPDGGRGKRRARSVMLEQETRILSLRKSGKSWTTRHIAETVGVSEGAVRWVLEHPRGGEG